MNFWIFHEPWLLPYKVSNIWLPVTLGADGRTGDAARCRRAPLTS